MGAPRGSRAQGEGDHRRMTRSSIEDLLAKGAKDKEDLATAAGGLLHANAVARILGITRAAVHKRLREKKLLAVRQGGEDKYPAIQFAQDGVVPGLPEVLQTIG